MTRLHYKCTMFMFYASIYVNAGVVLFSNKLKKKKKIAKPLKSSFPPEPLDILAKILYIALVET